RPGGEAIGLACGLTVRAFKPIFPTDLFEIGGTSRVIREKPLKFGEIRGERQVAAPVNVLNLGGAVHARITSTSRCGCQPDRHATNSERSRAGQQDSELSFACRRCGLLPGMASEVANQSQ